MELTITEYDRCPTCGKKTHHLSKEREGLFRAPCGAIVCKCGCHYTPKSWIDGMIQKMKSPIIQPG